MVKQSPHTRWKGCPICSYEKAKYHGDAVRTPFKELKKLGIKRRFSRNRVSDQERD